MMKNNRRPSYRYIPQVQNAQEEMGVVRKSLYMYTNKLGLNFSFVLMISLFFQFVVAAFIGLKAFKHLPVFAGLDNSGQVGQIVGIILGLAGAYVVQILLIAEMAQIVWLKYPDKLKVRLMKGSVWHSVMVLFLVASIAFDFFLLIMAITEKSYMPEAIEAMSKDTVTLTLTALISVLNMLTLIRCASVMRTSTNDEIKREIEERLDAISQEMLLDAGDGIRAKAKSMWSNLALSPERFLPLQESVFRKLSQTYPELGKYGGDTWGYDMSGNALVHMPPDVYTALSKNRTRAYMPGSSSAEKEEIMELWRMPPSYLAEMVEMNMQVNGKPVVIDATNPDKPEYITTPVTVKQSAPVDKDMETLGFLESLSPKEQLLFSKYLKEIFKKEEGEELPVNDSVYKYYDAVEIKYHYNNFQKSRK